MNRYAHVAQTAERVLGKDEVSGSIPDMGSMIVMSSASASREVMSASRRAVQRFERGEIATVNGR